MQINWDIVVKIIVPIGTLVLGKYLDRWFYRKPKLIYYLGHASAFALRGNPPGTVHTHSIVLRNAGRETACNVRVGHHILPDNYQLYPAVPHTTEGAPDGIKELVISRLVSGEQITISYLYPPSILWNQIHVYIKSDEGYAKALNVLPTPQLPKWAARILWVLIFVGSVSIIYLIIELIKWGVGRVA